MRVRVLMGTGVGCPGKPQGSPWHSLIVNTDPDTFINFMVLCHIHHPLLHLSTFWTTPSLPQKIKMFEQPTMPFWIKCLVMKWHFSVQTTLLIPKEMWHATKELYLWNIYILLNLQLCPSGKGGLASELPKAAWVSLETVKTSKTQRHPGTCKSKSTWNSIFKDSQSNFKAAQSTPKDT